MTQEEKAKAYDEALEKIKVLQEDWKSTHNRAWIEIEEVFPQLAESEDERIRKELIFFLKEEIPQCSIKEHADKLKEFVSYLEKQEWENPKEDVQTRFAFYTYKDEPEVVYLSNVFVEESSRHQGFGTRILKAAEMVAKIYGATTIRLRVRPDSSAKVWYLNHGYIYMTFESEYQWLEKNLSKMDQKSAEWNEEDETMLNSVIRIITQFDDLAHEPTYAGPKWTHPYTKEIAWLNELRTRLLGFISTFEKEDKHRTDTERETKVKIEELELRIIEDKNGMAFAEGAPTNMELMEKVNEIIRYLNGKAGKEDVNDTAPPVVVGAATTNRIGKVLALGFIDFLDKNRREGKMCLSNGECEDIEKAVREQDWKKLDRYIKKYISPEEDD